MANNNIIFNAVIQGATGGIHERWITSTVASSYTDIRGQIVLLANTVDQLLTTDPTISLNDGALMQSIAQGVFAERYLNGGESLTSIAQAIVALWTAIRSQFLANAISEYSWDFEGVIDSAGVIAVPGWAAFNSPVISQRDVGSTHSPQNPGVLNHNLDGAAADQSCIYQGPWDFSTIAEISANVLIPSAGGNELANCVLGFGMVQDPTSMDPASNGGLWNDNNVVLIVRSGGAGAGNWTIRRETAGAGAAASTGIAVTLDTWFKLSLFPVSSGTWNVSVNGTSSGTGLSGVLTSGIAYLGIGASRSAAAAGRNIAVDRIQVKTLPLAR